MYYDSDEVRDGIRSAAKDAFMRRTAGFIGFADLPPYDIDAINDFLAAEGNPWQKAIREYLDNLDAQPQSSAWERLQEFGRVVLAWAERVYGEIMEAARQITEAARQVLDKLRDWAAEVCGHFREFAERISTARSVEGNGRFVWQRRPRRPEVQQAHSVDAVAAGRSASTWLRTRVRGGRR